MNRQFEVTGIGDVRLLEEIRTYWEKNTQDNSTPHVPMESIYIGIDPAMQCLDYTVRLKVQK